MNSHIFYAKAVKGGLQFDNRKAFVEYLASVEDKKLVIKVELEKWKRSPNQNAYYWFYLRLIANETGHTEDELHQLFKRIFLKPTFIKVLGREIKIPSTTTSLTKYEFSEFLDRICAETSIPLPDPKKVSEILGNSPQYPINNLGEKKF